jgi:hypothetical protein
MHGCLNVDEILRLLACELVASKANATAVSLACCCRSFEDPALDALWETQDQLLHLLKSLPEDIWKEEGGRFVSPLTASTFSALNHLICKSFIKIPTKAEWVHFRKYARRVRELKVDTSNGPVALDILLVLQLRTANELLFPRLKSFRCLGPNETFIPFIPLFLSPKTAEIKIEFVDGPSTLTLAAIISGLSTLCPDLKCISFHSLPEDSAIVEAVSELLLGCNRNTLQEFLVRSPLTEEARAILHQFPRPAKLWAVLQGLTLLPQ